MATMQICLRTLIVPPVFSVASPKSCYIRPALHPGARRCSSVAYARYAPSSRLARRAHRRPRCEQDVGDATLAGREMSLMMAILTGSLRQWVQLISVRACGTTTCSDTAGNDGDNHANSEVAATAPTNWATTNIGTSTGLMPANVSVNARASVTAGLANEVDAVNQYAEVI